MWMMIGAAALGVAGQTYLACYLEQDGGRLPIEVVADEGARRAMVYPPLGKVVELPAMFTPDLVRVADGSAEWLIDRVNLDFERISTIDGRQSYTMGKCELKPAPERRAF